jgi:hypothetical protein
MMLLAIYGATLLFMVVLSFVKPTYDTYWALLLAIALSIICGSRDGGFDYEEYKLAFDAIHLWSEAEWSGVLLVAKDPGVVAIVNIAYWFSDTYFSAFFLMAVSGFVPKTVVSFMLPKFKTLFLALYALFLSPGLEFAAIRSAVGIGFLGLAVLSLCAFRYRAALFMISVGFHISLLPGFLLLIKRFWRIASSNFWFSPLIAILITLAGVGLIKELFESRNLEPGTLFAPFFPVITLGALFLFSRQKFVFNNTVESDRYRASIASATLFSSMAMIMAIPVAVASIRLLEVSFFFGVFSMIIAIARNKLSGLSIMALVFMVLILILINISRMTWATMAQASFL